MAICMQLLVAYAKKDLSCELSLYEITQNLGASVFDKTPLNKLLTNFSNNKNMKENYSQLSMFDLETTTDLHDNKI